MSVVWNPWHGCHKISDGCANCYVYRSDSKYGKDSTEVVKNSSFYDPLRLKRDGNFKIPYGETVYTCFTSDFFLDVADKWRSEIWKMIRERSDLNFLIITKRIHRFKDCIPDGWGAGYDNVHICCTVENQKYADIRLPIFISAPIKHKSIICEPLLGPLNIAGYLASDFQEVVVGGESGSKARICSYDWILDIRRQCIEKNINFTFKQTGAKLLKDGKLYNIERRLQHKQARKAEINYRVEKGETN